MVSVHRYGFAANDTALPTAADDPGVPGSDLQDMDTSLFVPAVVAPAPARTRVYPLTITLQNDPFNHFLGFMNSTVSASFSMYGYGGWLITRAM